MKRTHGVRAWNEAVVIPTYEPLPPDRNPMFLERRVYQGSSGKVYPLPFVDRISTRKTDRAWRAVFLENEFVQVMILPEIGGRIHAIVDKTNGYDVVYRQEVIKPALVGLAGPWISGGIEFNWPQHHRPSTFMPADVSVERHEDGSVTVWMSEHDPMTRMKGMHGVCLHPGKSVVELKVRLYNRTPMTQTFLWWANVATKVHEGYQSFFPPDVTYVADHAKRATSRYPLCEGRYYGMDYAARGRGGVPTGETPRRFWPSGARRANDLSWYANIPVPTSYMAMGSAQDFFGGYDHAARAGVVHVADHHISPGKKQWTWGNHEFGYAWDRNLSDDEAPYIELMAGVYTDNQPDFSYLAPGETKTFSQYWYPIREIGPAEQANVDAAVSLVVERRQARVAAIATSVHDAAAVTLSAKGKVIWKQTVTIGPDRPVVELVTLPTGVVKSDMVLTVKAADGRTLIEYRPAAIQDTQEVPAAATEPAEPLAVESTDELFTVGLHLQQYRHATRRPEAYWQEALRRDPLDARCNNALGLWHLGRGEFEVAERHFRSALQRLTSRNPNPMDGEASYNLGLSLRFLGPYDEAYAAFYKATWNYAWQAAGYLALAEIDCKRQAWGAALDHLDRSLRVSTDQLRARDLKAIVLRRLGRPEAADALLRETLELDPLDFMARWLLGQTVDCDTQVRLDLALDLGRAGLYAEVIDLLAGATPEPTSGTAPLVSYYRGYFSRVAGDERGARRHFAAAAGANGDYCFPARVEEIAILGAAIESNPTDANAAYYLGNLLYDRRRHREAIALWERAVGLKPASPTAWRNLGIGYFNALKDPDRARAAYEQAVRHAPDDARCLFERDQLWKRTGVSPTERLAELERRRELVQLRDDLSVELCSLYNLLGRHEDALSVLAARHFQPWEGGEGQALGQYVGTRLALGRRALSRGDAAAARAHFEGALETPANLGEARHLLANRSDVHYLLGAACAAAGDRRAAREHFATAAEFKGDFQDMSVRAHSEMTYYSAMALRALGREAEAARLLRELLDYARALRSSEAKVDYFATSLPTMLLFEDDLRRRRETTAMLLEAQAHVGLGNPAKARALLRTVLDRDPSHALATELMASLAATAARSRLRARQTVC